MKSPFTQLYVHCVWATWDRLPLLIPSNQQPIYAAITAKCDELRCSVVAIGGMPDHVHLLVKLSPSVSVAELMKEVKGMSSHLITHQIAPGEFFKWQGCYGAFSVSDENIKAVTAYIENQKQRHKLSEELSEWETTEEI
jgi:putative transposase